MFLQLKRNFSRLSTVHNSVVLLANVFPDHRPSFAFSVFSLPYFLQFLLDLIVLSPFITLFPSITLLPSSPRTSSLMF